MKDMARQNEDAIQHEVTHFASKSPLLTSLILLKPNTSWTAMCHLNLKRCEPVTQPVGNDTSSSMHLQVLQGLFHHKSFVDKPA